jgi:DivIVA domain-containing protein
VKKKDTTDTQMFSSAGAAPKPSATSKAMSPLDIQQKEFRVSRFGGYKMRDVDEFLDQITDSLTAVLAENQRLRTNAGVSPVVGTSDLQDVNRQADEIIRRAREEASSIVAEARDRATPSTPVASGEEDRAAIHAFLAREKEFLQGLAGLVQGHAEGVKGMAKAARLTPSKSSPAQASTEEERPSPDDHGSEGPEEPEEPEPAPAESGEATTSPAGMQDEGPSELEPVRVEEPEPAAIARGESEERPSEGGDRSLRDLFWGEE